MTYLSIRNWDRYQHYKDRRPVWIKYYVELLDDLEIRRLPVPTRLLWDQLLLLAAKYDNRILNDSEAIANATGMKREHVTNGIRTLIQGRWIKETRSSRRLAKSYPSRAPARSQEGEGEGERTSPKGVTPTSTPAAAVRSGMNGLPFAQELILQNILTAIGADADNGTPQVLRRYAVHLPEAALAKILESVTGTPKRDKASYAVAALKSECQERGIQVK